MPGTATVSWFSNPPAAAPLDSGATAYAAFSLSRLLKTTYAGQAKFRVRRSSDNAEVDCVGDNSATLEAEVLTHCFPGDGFIVTVYDQTGNSRHRTMSTAANQPRVCQNGVVEKRNNKVCCKFVDGTDTLPTNTAWFTHSTAFNQLFIYSHPGSPSLLLVRGVAQYHMVAENGSASAVSSQVTTAGTIYKNGSSVTATTRDQVYDNFNTNTLVSHALEGFVTSSTWSSLEQIGGYGSLDVGFDWVGYYCEELTYLTASQSNAQMLTAIAEQQAYFGF